MSELQRQNKQKVEQASNKEVTNLSEASERDNNAREAGLKERGEGKSNAPENPKDHILSGADARMRQPEEPAVPHTSESPQSQPGRNPSEQVSFSPLPSKTDHIDTMLRDRDTNEIVRVSRNAIAWRGKDDNVHHLARIVPDQDLERANMQVYALDPHPELQRLHALAHQLQESPYGITYGTREVNVGLQEPLERFIAKIAKDSASDSVNTYLHTVTATKPNTMMLRSQDYNVFKGTTTDGKVSLTHLFTASVDSERSHDGPKCVIKVANSEFAERLPKELKRHLIE